MPENMPKRLFLRSGDLGDTNKISCAEGAKDKISGARVGPDQGGGRRAKGESCWRYDLWPSASWSNCVFTILARFWRLTQTHLDRSNLMAQTVASSESRIAGTPMADGLMACPVSNLSGGLCHPLTWKHQES